MHFTLEVVHLQAGANGDPHLRFAHGGVADFRGKNNTIFNMLSVPGLSFGLKTLDTTFGSRASLSDK